MKTSNGIKKNKGFTPTPMNIGVSSAKAERGFTLVETLVAISIFTVSVISLMSVLSSGITGTKFANNKIIAGYLAQEGIEYVRNMRDTYALSGSPYKWNNFVKEFNNCEDSINTCGLGNSVLITNPKDYKDKNFIFKCSSGDCKLYINNGSYNNTVSGEESGFTREIWMDDTIDSGKDEVIIFSKVKWTQGSGEYDVTLSENLFDWIE